MTEYTHINTKITYKNHPNTKIIRDQRNNEIKENS